MPAGGWLRYISGWVKARGFLGRGVGFLLEVGIISLYSFYNAKEEQTVHSEASAEDLFTVDRLRSKVVLDDTLVTLLDTSIHVWSSAWT